MGPATWPCGRLVKTLACDRSVVLGILRTKASSCPNSVAEVIRTCPPHRPPLRRHVQRPAPRLGMQMRPEDRTVQEDAGVQDARLAGPAQATRTEVGVQEDRSTMWVATDHVPRRPLSDDPHRTTAGVQEDRPRLAAAQTSDNGGALQGKVWGARADGGTRGEQENILTLSHKKLKIHDIGFRI